jgi:hypothetical protein
VGNGTGSIGISILISKHDIASTAAGHVCLSWEEAGKPAVLANQAPPSSLQQDVDKRCYELTIAVDRCNSSVDDAEMKILIDYQKVGNETELMLVENAGHPHTCMRVFRGRAGMLHRSLSKCSGA